MRVKMLIRKLSLTATARVKYVNIQLYNLL